MALLDALLSNTRTDGVTTFGSIGNVDFRSDGTAVNLGNGLRVTSDGWESTTSNGVTLSSNGGVSISNAAAAEAVSSLLSSLF